MIHTWEGKKFDELERLELIEALNWCAEEIQRLRGGTQSNIEVDWRACFLTLALLVSSNSTEDVNKYIEMVLSRPMMHIDGGCPECDSPYSDAHFFGCSRQPNKT